MFELPRNNNQKVSDLDTIILTKSQSANSGTATEVSVGEETISLANSKLEFQESIRFFV